MVRTLFILLTLAGVCSADSPFRTMTGVSQKQVFKYTGYGKGPAYLERRKLFSADLTATPYAEFAKGLASFTFTRASVANYHNASGEVVEVAANLPRFGFADEGILMERGVVNALQWSEDLENAVWDNSGSSSAFHNSQLAPTAVSATTADEVRETADDTLQLLYQEYTGVANGIDVISFYMKKLQRDKGQIEWWDYAGGLVTQFYDLDAGTVLSASVTGAGVSILHASIESCTNDWYRCVLVVDCAADTSHAANVGPALEDLKGAYSGDAAKGIAVWGAMVEVRASSDTSYVTSYVKGVANGGTRYIDALTFAAAGNLPTSGGLTIIATASQPYGLFHSSGVVNTAAWGANGMWVMSGELGTPIWRLSANGVDLDGGTAMTTAAQRVAATWSPATEAAIFVGNARDGLDTSITTFPVLTHLQVGGSGTLAGHMFIKNVRVYSGILSAAEQALVP